MSRADRVIAILDAPIGPELDRAVLAASDDERRDACELIWLDLELAGIHLGILLGERAELLARWPALAGLV